MVFKPCAFLVLNYLVFQYFECICNDVSDFNDNNIVMTEKKPLLYRFHKVLKTFKPFIRYADLLNINTIFVQRSDQKWYSPSMLSWRRNQQS